MNRRTISIVTMLTGMMSLVSCATEIVSACEHTGLGKDCTPDSTGDWFEPPQGYGPQALVGDAVKDINQPEQQLRVPDSLDKIAIASLWSRSSKNNTFESCAADERAASELKDLLLTPDPSGVGLRFLRLGPTFAYKIQVTEEFSAKFESEFRTSASMRTLQQANPVAARTVLEAVTRLTNESRSRGVRAGTFRYLYPQNLDQFLPRFSALASPACRGDVSLVDGIVYGAITSYENVAIEGSSASIQSRLETELTGLELPSNVVVDIKADMTSALRATFEGKYSKEFGARLQNGIFIPIKVRKQVYGKLPPPPPKSCSFALNRLAQYDRVGWDPRALPEECSLGKRVRCVGTVVDRIDVVSSGCPSFESTFLRCFSPTEDRANPCVSTPAKRYQPLGQSGTTCSYAFDDAFDIDSKYTHIAVGIRDGLFGGTPGESHNAFQVNLSCSEAADLR